MKEGKKKKEKGREKEKKSSTFQWRPLKRHSLNVIRSDQINHLTKLSIIKLVSSFYDNFREL